ncbi:UDP-N-acetylglucosamine transferase subunit alg14 [Paracoccidioides lutzii Pb01]|uniref:UDP-N-acetylglucosamine transferase subunit ALG14 n=1 Tax=Paracoccidioides lutzii (strain ATCC MYA-826 / Pb01) TaxID=502779 RepID=C1HAK3_PARBA|nr:UDP-N-acetylglucosamine transferase subunit alg14 [Paracoccidioides lutzii Pb01]EEH37376.2 UDP-N-acetylglucosamine transferase subunit alg14 [Paracoccidioides lutzii Pb01]
MQIAIYYDHKPNNGSGKNRRSPGQEFCRPVHLLIVLGSGGHTAEMLSMLKHAPLDTNLFTKRTYVVSSGDSFSALKAVEYEQYLLEQQQNSPPASASSEGGNSQSQPAPGRNQATDIQLQGKKTETNAPDTSSPKTPFESPSPSPLQLPYTIVTVPRARRVHQSYLTAPISTLHCLWACIQVLRCNHSDQKLSEEKNFSSQSSSSPSPPSYSTTPFPSTPYPDIILTNGPATAVCVIIAAKILRTTDSILPFLSCFFQLQRPQDASPRLRKRYLRTIFVESWARVTTLSLSGKIVLPLVDRFLVQWDGLDGYSSCLGGKAEFAGALVA